MIVIQTSRIFVVQDVQDVQDVQNFEGKTGKIIPIDAIIDPKKEQIEYTKKAVNYFIPEFYI